jgi:hypothetical protein
MHFLGVAAALGVLGLIAGQESPNPPPAAGPERDLPVSLTRIREALQRPANPLTLPAPKADFHVDVRGQHADLLGPIDFTSGTEISPIPGQRTPGSFGGGVSVDPVAGARGIRHYFAEKAAREEVARALREFCATHPCPPPQTSPR